MRRLYREFVIKNFLKNSHKIITGSKILIKLIIKNYDLSVDKFIYNNHPTPRVFIDSKSKLKKNINIKTIFYILRIFGNTKITLIYLKDLKGLIKNIKISINLY